MSIEKHAVIFAGAGPGDPELITVKAMNVLKTADLIIYAGSLVPEAVLCWKGPDTQTVSSADMDLKTITKTISAAYHAGDRVVRLHTGDPALYGAIFEQMRILDQLKIPYAAIPGVTAAFAAAAKMNMEYTLPEIAQTLILTRISGRTPVPDTENFESLAAHQASMAVYLSIGHTPKIQKILEKHYGKDAWCAVAYKVSHPEERIIYSRIRNLEKTCADNGIERHALIIVGNAIDAQINGRPVSNSKLYDAAFSHGYRRAKPQS